MTDKENLPKGWTIAKLGEIVITEKGKKPKRVSKFKTKECSIPYVNIKAFEKNIIDEYTDGVGCVLCEHDDFLMVWDGSRSGYVGKAIKGALGSTLVKIKLPLMNQDYVYYFLQSKFIEINTRAKGVGIPHVDPNLLWNYDFPIAPLPEQKRILAKLEQLLTDLDKGIEYLETTKQQLKVYRQAVLKWAFEGKLTNKNVKDGELPKGWEWKKSKELFSFVTSGSRGWAKYYSKIGSIFIRITNLDFDTLDIDLAQDKIQYVNPPNNSEGLRTKVQEGDFLFSITGYLGMFAIAPKLESAFVNQHIALCRPKNDFNKKYVGYWIISKSGGNLYLNKLRKGATKAGLGLDDIKDFPVPMAPFAEQKKIVQEVESRLSVCNKIEESIESSLQQAEALRLSIIKKAFEGKLVLQDPNDEPAEKLLERIRAAKEKEAPSGRKVNSTRAEKYSNSSVGAKQNNNNG